MRQTNCLTEIFFDEAIERARQLDRERRESPDRKAPYYGLTQWKPGFLACSRLNGVILTICSVLGVACLCPEQELLSKRKK